MIQHLSINRKNGPHGFVIHHYEIDTSLPKMKVEGMQYKFNSRLIRSEYFQDKK